MTATAIHAPPPRRSGSRTAAIVVASLLGVLSLAAGAAGAVALWGDSERDDQGYFSTATHTYTASTSALTTEELDLDADIPNWLAGDDGSYGDVRLRVAAGDGGPVFAGIARTADVERYLAGASRTEVTDIDTDPFDVEYAEHGGAGRPAAPAGEDIWAASTQGPGRQTLDWEARDGHWSVVVMNPDGSRGIDADVSAGVKVSFLGTLGWSLLGGSALLLLGAIGTGYAGLRRR